MFHCLLDHVHDVIYMYCISMYMYSVSFEVVKYNVKSVLFHVFFFVCIYLSRSLYFRGYIGNMNYYGPTPDE